MLLNFKSKIQRCFETKHSFQANLLTFSVLQISVAAYLWIFLGLTIERLSTTLGIGDITGTYMFQEVLWRREWSTNDFGYPTGISVPDLANYEILQSIFIGLSLLFSDNIFLAVNLGIYFAHLMCANLVFVIARTFGMNRPLSLISAFASSTLPWIPGRIEHPGLWYLSLSLTPLLLTNLKVSRGSYARSLFLGLLVGSSGGYVVAFACVVTLGVFLSDFQRIRENLWRIGHYGFFALGVGIISICSLIFFGFSSNSTLLDRTLQDSVHYGGYLLLALIPLVSTPLPSFLQERLSTLLNQLPATNESTWSSNFGSIVVIFACSIIAVSLLINTSKKNRNRVNFFQDLSKRVLIGTIIITAMFCAKGGFGPLLTATVFPPIRAWNRLIVIIEICLILLALLLAQGAKTSIRRMVIVILIPLLMMQGGANSSLVPSPREGYLSDLRQMNRDMSFGLSAGCGILQIPELKSDGSGAPSNLKTYDHYLAGIIGKDFKWSFGQRLQDFSQVIDETVLEEDVIKKIRNEFCAVEIDRNWKGADFWIRKFQNADLKKIHDSKNFIVYSVS